MTARGVKKILTKKILFSAFFYFTFRYTKQYAKQIIYNKPHIYNSPIYALLNSVT